MCAPGVWQPHRRCQDRETLQPTLYTRKFGSVCRLCFLEKQRARYAQEQRAAAPQYTCISGIFGAHWSPSPPHIEPDPDSDPDSDRGPASKKAAAKDIRSVGLGGVVGAAGGAAAAAAAAAAAPAPKRAVVGVASRQKRWCARCSKNHSEADPPPPTPLRKMCEDCGTKGAIYPTAAERGTIYCLPGEETKRWCSTCARGHNAHPSQTRPTPARTKRGQKRERSSPDEDGQNHSNGIEISAALPNMLDVAAAITASAPSTGAVSAASSENNAASTYASQQSAPWAGQNAKETIQLHSARSTTVT